MENKIKQLRKGILELAILGSLYRENHYGYSLVKTLSDGGKITVAEGTIYPILGRLAREGLIQSKWVESSQGPPRKYYSLTPEGKQTVEILTVEFGKLAKMIESINRKPEKIIHKGEGKKISVSKET